MTDELTNAMARADEAFQRALEARQSAQAAPQVQPELRDAPPKRKPYLYVEISPDLHEKLAERAWPQASVQVRHGAGAARPDGG